MMYGFLGFGLAEESPIWQNTRQVAIDEPAGLSGAQLKHYPPDLPQSSISLTPNALTRLPKNVACALRCRDDRNVRLVRLEEDLFEVVRWWEVECKSIKRSR